jgi:hypothetical protein
MASEAPHSSRKHRRCARHGIAAGPDGQCALCRSEMPYRYASPSGLRSNARDQHSQRRAHERNRRGQLTHDELSLNAQHAIPEPTQLRIPACIRTRTRLVT